MLINIPCAVLGGVIASNKMGTLTGVLLGLLFGPLGMIAAFAVDNRPTCPSCTGRLNGEEAVICPPCRTSFRKESTIEQIRKLPPGTGKGGVIRFDCPSCDAPIVVLGSSAGKNTVCGECGEAATVPQL